MTRAIALLGIACLWIRSFYEFPEGLRSESIADDFPVLTLEEVYGGIAFYLGHRDEVDAHLRQVDEKFSGSQCTPAQSR